MKTEQKLLEIINAALAKNSHMGDDCAFLKDFNLVVTQDTLVEGVHFNLSLITPKQLGRRAMLVNISDVLASGAKPKYLTVSLSGLLSEDFVREFYLGVNEICGEFDVEIVGGDLTGGEKITVSICAFGDTRGREISSRSNAHEGYIVVVRGVFGAGLLSNYLLEPKLFPETVEIIATKTQNPYALMDSSDSLYDCLEQISRLSGVAMDIEFEKIPNADGDFKTTLFGGEDYALVGCFAPEDFEILQNCGAKMVQIGTVVSGAGVFVDKKKNEDDFTYENKLQQ